MNVAAALIKACAEFDETLPDGRVRLELRKPFYTGQNDIVFKPVDFLRRLAEAIPRPRQNMIRIHGIFAPNAKNRPK